MVQLQTIINIVFGVAVVGGILYSVLKHLKQKKEEKARNNSLLEVSKTRSLNVVITGGSRGIGFALAKKFLEHGDNVVICSRSSNEAAINKLKELTKKQTIWGTTCDVSSFEQVEALTAFAVSKLPHGIIDLWVNNAGVDGKYGNLVDVPAESIDLVVRTNLTGLLYCCKSAMQQMLKQPQQLPGNSTVKGHGHIYNMEGLGSRGENSIRLSMYGCTKYGLVQLSQTLSEECKGTGVGVHRSSPGMVITDLLVADKPLSSLKIFNILAEEANVVADYLVPNMRKSSGTSKRFAFLTPLGVLYRFATAFMRKNRFFNEKGEPVYKKDI